MKKRYLSLLAFILVFVFSVTSCKKSSTPTNNITNNDTANNNNDSTNTGKALLTEFVAIDTTDGIAHDTAQKIVYTYDSLNRLTSSATGTYDALHFNLLETSYYIYTYTGTDTVPSKIYTYFIQSNTVYTTDTFSLTYNAGNIVNITDENAGNSSLITYNSTANFSSSQLFLTNPPIDTSYYQQAVTNGNITSGELDDHRGIYFDYNFSGITYDTHKNPFVGVIMDELIKTNQGASDEEAGYFGGNDISTNNVTACTTTETSNATYYNYDATYPYAASLFVYNANNYPVSCRFNSARDNYAGVKYYFYK
jgi:hypothetical protein